MLSTRGAFFKTGDPMNQISARLAWSLERTTAPINRPVSIESLKRAIRISVEDDSHDETLLMLIDGATEQVEHDTSSALITQTYKMKRDCFPSDQNYIYLPVRPVQSVSHVKYFNFKTETETTFSDWYFDQSQNMIVLNRDESWPTNDEKVVITFVAGYGDTEPTIPTVLRQAIFMQSGKWFQNPTMDMNDIIYTDAPYRRLIERFTRSDYP